MTENERRFTGFLTDAVADAAVSVGGGAGIDGAGLTEKLQAAFEGGLKRLYPRFADGDYPVKDWEKVFTNATQGTADPLKAVGHAGQDADHPVVRAIRAGIPGKPGDLWSAVRKTFEAAPYGWPRDAVDAAVAVLVAAGEVNATRANADLVAKDLAKNQANAIRLAGEDIVIGPSVMLAARATFVALDGKQVSDEEVRTGARDLVGRLTALATAAGGDPPLPLASVPAYLTDMGHETGNQLIQSLATNAKAIQADIAT